MTDGQFYTKKSFRRTDVDLVEAETDHKTGVVEIKSQTNGEILAADRETPSTCTTLIELNSFLTPKKGQL